MDGACSMHGRDETTYTIFVIKPVRTRLKFKDYDIQNHNFAGCFVWVCNLVAGIEGGKEAEGV